MSSEGTTAYYRRREERERWLAQASTDPGIAAIHHDLAMRYNALLAELPETIEQPVIRA